MFERMTLCAKSDDFIFGFREIIPYHWKSETMKEGIAGFCGVMAVFEICYIIYWWQGCTQIVWAYKKYITYANVY